MELGANKDIVDEILREVDIQGVAPVMAILLANANNPTVASEKLLQPQQEDASNMFGFLNEVLDELAQSIEKLFNVKDATLAALEILINSYATSGSSVFVGGYHGGGDFPDGDYGGFGGNGVFYEDGIPSVAAQKSIMIGLPSNSTTYTFVDSHHDM